MISVPSRLRPLLRPAAGPLASAALVVACGTTLDEQKLETEIASGIQQQTGVTATIDCPGGRDAKAGDVFTCTGTTSDGQTITVTVTQTDDQGNVNWEVTSVN